MSNKPKLTCAECIFAVANDKGRELHGVKPTMTVLDTFTCHRYPPAPIDGRRQSRPNVSPADWCGEFLEDTPAEAESSLEWREINQLDPEARLTLSALAEEAEFKDLEDGGTWHAVHDHIYEMEEACPGNVGEHIKAGLRVRVPVAKT